MEKIDRALEKIRIDRKTAVVLWVFGIATVVLGIVTSTKLLGYILIIETPVIGLLMILVSNLIDLIMCVVQGASDIGSLKLAILVIIMAILIHTNISALAVEKIEYNKGDRRERSRDKYKKLKSSEKLNKALTYERLPYKVPWWTKICIYSMIIVLIMQIANSDSLDLYNNTAGFKVFAAIAICLSAIELFGIITTSSFTYEILAIKVILETYTVSLLIDYNNLHELESSDDWTKIYESIALIMIEVVIFVYYLYKISQSKEKENNKSSQGGNRVELKVIEEIIKEEKESEKKDNEEKEKAIQENNITSENNGEQSETE
jgi:hypothetical protein